MKHEEAVEYLAAQENDQVAIPDDFYNREESLTLAKEFVDTLVDIPETTQALYVLWRDWLTERALAE